MSDGDKCEACGNSIEPERALHRQTKYCLICARARKNKLTSESRWSVKDRAYQHAFRQRHPGYNNKYVALYRARKAAEGPFSRLPLNPGKQEGRN
jgi:methionyl-tRNA synthetase